MNKALVAYFSASGVTARLAARLAATAQAELYEIKPQQPYTKADLNWNDTKSRSTLEMKDPASRPALADLDANLDAYDTIYLGFPIWWYVAPTIINSFLEQYDFSGKRIVLFATSGSSGMGKTLELLKPSAPAAIWSDGGILRASAGEQELRDWLARTAQ